MKRILPYLIFLTSCLEVTHEEWKAECDSHPYYDYYSEEQVRKIRNNGGSIGGGYFGGTGPNRHDLCSPKDLRVFWDDTDSKASYTVNAVKEITGAEVEADVFKYLEENKILDLRGYPEIYDLRPLYGLTFYAEEIYLPRGAEVNTLWGLEERTTEYNVLKVLDAPDVKVIGGRPEDCPLIDQMSPSWAFGHLFYSPAVIDFCKSQRGEKDKV